MNKEIFSIKPYKSIYFNAMLAKKIGFQLGDELEFRFTSDSAYFRINNNQIKGVKVYQASTSGFTINNRIVHKRLSKLFMYDVNVIEDDGWFKIIRTVKMEINNMVNHLRDGIIQVKIGMDTDRAGIEAIKKLVSITFPEDSTHIFDDEEQPFKYRRSKYIYLSKYRWGLWKIQNRKDKRLDVVSSSKVVDLFTQDSAKV